MRKAVAAVLLALTLTGCQPQIVRLDPQDPAVMEILTRPGIDEEQMREEFSKLLKLSEGAVTKIDAVDGKIQLALKPPAEDALEAAINKFTEGANSDPTPSGLIGALIGALATAGTVFARRQWIAKGKTDAQKP